MKRTSPAAAWVLLPAVAAVAALAADSSPAPSPTDGLRPQPADLVERLSGTRWDIQLEPMYGRPPAQALTDILRFQGELVTSDDLAASGFASGRYTLTLDPEGVPAWEATQINREEGIVLWKGEFHDGSVRGIMSRHPLKGETQDFIFVGQEVTEEPPATP
jgi:hypothetical protein